METTTSQKQIEANHRNALKSTGPKTPEGKGVSRWNALTHGLLAKEVVIESGDGKEDRAEFEDLLSQLREDRQPEGVLEEMLVERIATCYWRLMRVHRCEMGELRKKLNFVKGRETAALVAQFRSLKSSPLTGGSRQSLQRNSFGLEDLIYILAETRDQVEAAGRITSDAYNLVISHFDSAENGFARVFNLHYRSNIEKKGKKDDEADQALPRYSCEATIELIDEETGRLENLRKEVRENEKLELEAQTAILALPSKGAADRILRYETTIERQLYRAVNELERLQRRRRGDIVPPPINVQLSTE